MSDNQHTQSNSQVEDINTEVNNGTPAEAAADSAQDQYKDMFLRVSADFQNYKRRMDKERTQWMRVGQSSIIESFLPLIDDIDRAIKSAQEMIASDDETEENREQFLKGFLLVQKNAQKALSDMGVTHIDCSGEFDPMYHEALLQVDSDAHATGHIVDILTPGYMYKDQVVRHAKVSVAR